MIPALIEVANLLATSPFIPPNLQGALLLSSSILVIFFRAFSQGSQLTVLPKKVEEIPKTIETAVEHIEDAIEDVKNPLDKIEEKIRNLRSFKK
jgi:hypothetical protein